ncbi:MAG TPA: CopD family protein [Agitococcus sp.]|nr:CopD family protein [Agitococcus sp.]
MTELFSELLEPSLLTLVYGCLAISAGSAIWSLIVKDWPWLKSAKYAVYGLMVLLPCYLWQITVELTDTDWPNLFSSAFLVISQSNLGQMWLLMCGGQLLALFAILYRPLTAPYQQITLLAAVFVYTLARAASGHAAEAGLLGGAVWIHAIHIWAACLWLGLIICYLLTFNHNTNNLPYNTQQLSELATLCLMALVLTGFADSLRIYQLADNFWQSEYSKFLFLKLAIIAVALGLAATNRFYTLPRLANKASLFYWLVSIESIVIGLALGVASYLGGLMP